MRPVISGGAGSPLRRKRGIITTGARRRTRALLACLTLALCVAAALAATLPARAQGPGNFLQLPDTEKGIPMLVQADEMIYDFDADTVTARGNVEIYYDDYSLNADQVIYDKRADTVTADGKVRMKEPDGNVIFAQHLVVTGDFRKGFINSLAVLTPEHARMAAASAQRLEGNIVVLHDAAYTACRADPKDPDKPPIWQLKAVRVIHNQKEKTIRYEDATFEFSGVPIAYIPYFEHPDPTVQRKSGFLAPSFYMSDQLGAGVATPYFFALAPNYDVTLTPRITQKQGLLVTAEWRHRLDNGSYFVRASGIAQTDPAALKPPGNRRLRGSVESAGQFRINNQWVTGWDLIAASDNTFMRIYDLNDETEYVSQAYLVGQSERNYFDLRAMHLEEVAARRRFLDPILGITLPVGTPIDPATGAAFTVGGVPLPAPGQPLVHPVLDYNYLFENSIAGGELGFDISAYSLTRDVGADSSRIVAEAHWRRTFTDSMGQQITPFLAARGDLYLENEVFDPTVPGGLRGQETVTRFIPTAGLDYRYPFISTHEWGSQVIEPIAQIVVRPDEQYAAQISNEDAQSLVFDDTLLFDPDKFSGFDRVQGGTRANIGVRYTLQTNDWGYGSVILGQSFQLAGANPFNPATGLGGTESDIVGGIYLEPNKYFGLSSQFRLDNADLALMRHEVKGWVRAGPVYTTVTYAKYRQMPSLAVVSNREEILAGAALNLTDQWRLFGSARYDLVSEQRAQNSIGIGYFCDCLTARIDYTEDYFVDRDIEPNRTIKVQIDLKTLGGTTLATAAP